MIGYGSTYPACQWTKGLIVYTICAVEYEWDEAKSEANIAAGRPGFDAIEEFEWETAMVEHSDRHGEPRWAATGYIEDRLYRVVYTRRGDRRRIISLRKASTKEMRDYA